MGKRVFLIVLDSMGIGEMPDAGLWNDEGSNTLGAIRRDPAFHCPHLAELGLFHIAGVGGGKGTPAGAFARMREASMGKDTTTGHWEIAGHISENPMPTFPDGFPEDVLQQIREATGRDILCNKPYSGTEVIKDYGREHEETGKLIVYTSADSVLQIAAHESVIPVEELYDICRKVRRIMVGRYGVGRIIARPFEGEWPYQRTVRRHDFSLKVPDKVMPDLLTDAGLTALSVGKIIDIFAERGFSDYVRTESNADGIDKTLRMMDRDFEGLCFVNLVDFDMSYGHRNDISGYAAAMSYFDSRLPEIMDKLREEDILMITADHGCDPSTDSTDHSREYTPLIIYGKRIRAGADLGTRACFADISASILEYFGTAPAGTAGESFLRTVLMSDREILMRAAQEARQYAYVPYSGFRVGAALMTDDGKVYTGCNIENASYPVSLCAERTALAKAVSSGVVNFRGIAIAGGTENDISAPCFPCGMCRQALAEFCAPSTPVYLTDGSNHSQYTVGSLLPAAFVLK